MNEFQLIKKYFEKLSKNNKHAKNLNEDVFFNKKKKLVISVDTYNQGIHFFNFKNPDLVIKKVIRSSISDLICKGVKPEYYFISASGNKKHFTKKNLLKISNSLKTEQNKYRLKLSGGDTTNSKTVSFTITTIGFANCIVERNKAQINDDIYVTGNIGDSFIGQKIIKNKMSVNSKIKNYFVNQYYCPKIPFGFYKYIKKIANTSIDISDGLVEDMNKLINKQNFFFQIDINKVPISNILKKYLLKNNKKREKYLFNGDDYQILFTSPKKNRNLIKKISNKMNQKITFIGRIVSKPEKNIIFSDNKSLNPTDFQGYSHKF